VTAAVVIVGILAARGPAAPQGAEPASEGSLGAVTALYRSGDRGAAVATIGLWTQGEVESGSERLLESLRAEAKAGTSKPADVDATARASVALMSDAALRALRQADPRRAR
jgi:hypothetical protein